jgi:(+)-pinoresinol hydroxylase
MTVPLTEAQSEKVHVQQVGIPNLEFFAFGARNKGNPNPTSGHMWFSPVIPRTAEAIFEANRVFEEAVEEYKIQVIGLKPFALPSLLMDRNLLMILGFPITDDPGLNKSFVQGFRQLIDVSAKHGWGEYRTPAIYQDQVMGVYSFNNNILRRFHETVKDAVDPKGIISPGRYGIWPKHLRSKPQ